MKLFSALLVLIASVSAFAAGPGKGNSGKVAALQSPAQILKGAFVKTAECVSDTNAEDKIKLYADAAAGVAGLPYAIIGFPGSVDTAEELLVVPTRVTPNGFVMQLPQGSVAVVEQGGLTLKPANGAQSHYNCK